MNSRNELELKLSKGQVEWVRDEIMAGTYQYEDDPDYQAVWTQLNEDDGRTIAGASAFVGLEYLMTGIIDRVNYGDRDPQAYRDKGFAQRIMKKVEAARMVIG